MILEAEAGNDRVGGWAQASELALADVWTRPVICNTSTE